MPNCEELKFKQIKPDFNNIDTTSISDAYNEMMNRFWKAVEETEDKIIKNFAKEQGLSLKCAEYHIRRHFNFRIETISPNSMIGTPKFNLYLEPKSVEEILRDIDTLPSSDLTDCDKELLRKEVIN